MPTANVGALVGRDREVELLAELLARLLEGVRRRATETVVIEGEAGIGKSRLLASLADAAGDLDVTVLRGAGIRWNAPARSGRSSMRSSFGSVRPTCAGPRSGSCCRARMARALGHTCRGSSSSCG